MKKDYYKITVEGTGLFPMDMLRFGECYPNTSADANNMSYPNSDRRKVELITYGAELHAHTTCERFKSFTWKAEYEVIN